jgi:ribose 5-phosphate isomerase B
MQDAPLAIASDHAGFEQKQQLTTWLLERGFEVCDLGPADDQRADYPDYALLVAREVASGRARFGILVCGTGIGMAIAANKVAGIRAANVTDPRFAALAREHNDANIITLSGRFVDVKTNRQALERFLTTPFGGERHTGRVTKIHAMEQSQR